MGNPFVYRQALDGREGFFGRASEITRISSRIAADRPQSVSVVGEPRGGKTSLLKWLCDPRSRAEYLDQPERYQFVYLCLSRSSPQNPEGFFAQLGQAWRQAGGQEMVPTYDGFGDVVKELMGQNRRLLLLLDDFGIVTQGPGFTVGFFSFMRSVANNHDVGYVTTSTLDLQKLCHTQDIEDSPFFNIFTTVHLEPYKEGEAQEMVRIMARQAGVGLDEEAGWIAELAGGSPYLLQLTANLAFAAKSQGAADRQAVADRAFREAQAYLSELWEEYCPPVQQEVLRSILAGKPVDRRQEYAVEALERRGHLHRVEGSYRLRAGLMARYVAEAGRQGFWRRLLG